MYHAGRQVYKHSQIPILHVYPGRRLARIFILLIFVIQQDLVGTGLTGSAWRCLETTGNYVVTMAIDTVT